jgi:hypothetical protein
MLWEFPTTTILTVFSKTTHGLSHIFWQHALEFEAPTNIHCHAFTVSICSSAVYFRSSVRVETTEKSIRRENKVLKVVIAVVREYLDKRI